MIPYGKLSDREVFMLLMNGDQSAFAEIYHRYKEVLYLHANRSLNNHDEARDMVQELFENLWTKRESIAVPNSVDAYLYGSIRNRILNFIAHQKVIDKYIDSLDSFLELGSSFTDNIIREKELGSMLEEEIKKLPKKMKEIFELSRKHGMSYKEIGIQLNISDQSVRKQVQRALKILRIKIKLNLLLSFFC